MGLRSGLSVPAWQPGAYRSRRPEADAEGAAVAGGVKKNGAYEIKDKKALDDLAAMVAPDGRVSRDYVNKSAQYIAKAAGLDVPDDTRVLIGECPADHPLVQIELMMPILGIVRVDNVLEGIDLACDLEHGNQIGRAHV